MSDYGRVFDAARREQGFRDQGHLDAFYRSYDHQKGCGVCSSPGPSYWSEADASWQPTRGECAEGRRLFLASR